MELVVIQKQGGRVPLNAENPFRRVIKAEHRQSLLSEDVISISVDSKKPITFHIGDKIEYAGRNFYLNQAPKIKREQGFYAYDLTFEGVQYSLRNKIYFNLDKTGFQTSADFPLTGEIDIFLKVLVDNINSISDTRWILGEFPENTDTKTLTFSSENCLAVLQKICEEWATEFELKEDLQANTITLNIKKIGENLPYSFEYGMGNGLYTLSRDNEANDVITRLYAYGSTENIPNNYRDYSERLRMPQSVGDYIQDEDKVRLFGLKEAVKNFDEIKPTFKGIVSRVGAFDTITKTQEIEVQNMDFDLNERKEDGSTKWLIPDTAVKLYFNKGNLAGYSFELMKYEGYNHATKTFKVKQFADERGQKFPDIGTIFEFAVGDEFTLIDLVMPDEYITRAENKLLEEARKEYEKISQNNVKYTLDIDPLFLKQKGNENTVFFRIGDYVHLVDRELNIDKHSRIINLTRDLLNPFDFKIDIADTYEISFTQSVLQDIRDTKKIVVEERQKNREQYRRGYKNLEELKNSVFDTEGYFDPTNIKPHSIEANMISVGAKNQLFTLENITLNPNLNGDANKVSITAGKLVHFSMGEDIKEWSMMAVDSFEVLDMVYYVYAKVERNGALGSWHITPEKIKFDQDAAYYHFLCYVLYTPKNEKREAEAMYGNTLIHGGQITTGRIQSTNGQTFFDLETGEIRGKIEFTADSPAFEQVKDPRIPALIEKTDFLKTTTVQGNTIATGNVVLGNHLGINSGITGLGGNQDVFLWGGADYTNKDNAPITLTRDGKLVMRHANGNIGFEIGIFNGFLTLNGYHEEGFKLFEIDPNRGFVNVGYVLESWKPVQVVYLGNKESFREFVKINVQHFWGGPGDQAEWDFTASIYPNRTIYDYQNGTRPDKEKYAQYIGYKIETHRREEQYNVPDGWYYMGKMGVLAEWTNSQKNIKLIIHYIENGKITQTKTVMETYPR